MCSLNGVYTTDFLIAGVILINSIVSINYFVLLTGLAITPAATSREIEITRITHFADDDMEVQSACIRQTFARRITDSK